MKKAFAALAVVLVVALAAALVAPSFIDWTGHKATIEREISAATGRTLAIDGHVEAALLPTPRFVATNLRLAGPDPATDLASVGRVELRLAWAPLLTFRIQVTSIRLVDPVLSLPALTQPPEPDGAGDGAPSAAPAWRSVKLDNVVIENGRLILPAPAGMPPSTVEQISGRLSAESLTGPVRATGAAVAQGIPLTFDTVLGDFASTRGVPASLNVELRPGLAKLQYRGTLARDGARWTAQGRVTVDSPNFAAALAAAGIPVSADVPMAGALAQPFALGATFNGDGGTWTINDTSVQLGDARAEGAVSLLLGPRPAVDAAFAISRLDIDRLRRLTLPAATPRAAGATDSGTRLPVAPAVQPGWVRGVDVSLDLGIDALVLGDGVLRQVRINAATRQDDLVINQASAQLPGGSEIVLIGQIDGSRNDPGAARIDGAVEINSNNLRGLLQWAGIDLAAVPRDRLRRFEGTARLEGTLARPTFSAIDMRLDSSRLTGGLTLAVGDRIAFGADLRLDQLNVDAYRLTEPPPTNGSAPTDAATPAPPLSPLDWLNRFDTNLRLRIASLTWGTATADGLVADLTLSQGAIELRELAIRALAGATLRATGRLANLATAPTVALDLELKANEADGILRLAGINLPPGLGALALIGHLDARQGADIALRGLDLRLGDTHLTGQARLVAIAPRLAWSAELEGDTVSLDILASSMAATPARPRAAQPALTAPVLRNPAVSAGRTEAGWSRQGLGLEALREMDADIALSARLLSMNKLKLADARLALKLRETEAELTSLSGSIYGGRLDGKATLDLRQAPALSATANLTGVELRQMLELIAGTDALRGPADLNVDLRATGDSQAALMATLAGTLRIASSGGSIDGYDLPAMSEKLKRIDRPTDLITLVQLGLGGGRTPFTRLDGNFRVENGIARTDDLKLVAQAGEMRTTGTIDLPRWLVDLVNEFYLTEHPKLPPLALKISGPIDAPRRIFDIERLQSHLLRRGSEGTTR